MVTGSGNESKETKENSNKMNNSLTGMGSKIDDSIISEASQITGKGKYTNDLGKREVDQH